MSDINRRNFLKASTGAFCSSALTGTITAKSREKDLRGSSNAKIYTIFFQTVVSSDDTSVVPTSNEEILKMLKQSCDGIDFIIREIKSASDNESVINEMQDLKKLKFDGVLIFGAPGNYALFEAELPTIVVYSIHDFMNIPYTLFLRKGKILTETIDRWHFCTSPDVSSTMYKELIEKIKLFKVLKQMKESRILVCSTNRYVDVYHGDSRKGHPPGYNEIYQNVLDQLLGTKATIIGINEVAEDKEIKDIWYNDNKEAEEIAKMWISEAADMINTLESEVVRSAKVYLALKILMKKYDANAIAFHLRSLIKNPKPEDKVWPSMGNSELQKQGIVGCCQAHVDVVLTHMLAQYAFGRPSMMGDYMIDTFNNVSYMMHCGAPWNPRGGDDRIPYIITDHRERNVRAHSKPGVGACTSVLYPPNEPATMWRIDIMSKDVLVHTGVTISNPTAYARGYTSVPSPYKVHWNETMCKTKLGIKVDDAKKIQNYVFPDKYGVHKSGTLGDYRERIKDLSTLIGLNVIEEDR